MAYMTFLDYITPMNTSQSKRKNIYFIIYPGFELLDLSGPMSVFSGANGLANETLYDIKTLSVQSGLITSGAGLTVASEKLTDVSVDSSTSVFVVGAEMTPLINAASNSDLVQWLQTNIPSAERYGSICSGTFILQSAGVLKDKTVTTH